MRHYLLFVFILLLGTTGFSLDLPQNLSSQERDTLAKTVGLSTSNKLLSKPISLGGYQGFEIGASLEVIDTSVLEDLGDRSSTQKTYNLTRITLGKGLFSDIDTYLHFAMPFDGSQVVDWGGSIKWNFHQFKFLPVVLSFLASGNNINFNSSFIHTNFNGQLLIGLQFDRGSTYFGFGKVRSTSEFSNSQGTDGISDSSKLTSTQVEHTQLTFGANYDVFDKVFLAAEWSKYEDDVFSFKLGKYF